MTGVPPYPSVHLAGSPPATLRWSAPTERGPAPTSTPARTPARDRRGQMRTRSWTREGDGAQGRVPRTAQPRKVPPPPPTTPPGQSACPHPSSHARSRLPFFIPRASCKLRAQLEFAPPSHFSSRTPGRPPPPHIPAAPHPDPTPGAQQKREARRTQGPQAWMAEAKGDARRMQKRRAPTQPYLMAAGRRKGRSLSPTILLGSSPTSEILLPVETGACAEPHGTCSSSLEPGRRGSASIGPRLLYCPAPCSVELEPSRRAARSWRGLPRSARRGLSEQASRGRESRRLR